MKIALVSCSKDKQNSSCSAKEIYSKSTLFKKAINYIQHQDYDKWYILSAKFGLLDPNETIEPYDVTLNNMKSNEVKEWSQKVYEQLLKYSICEIDFYAGEKYRKYLIPLLENKNIICNVPLKGLGIGQQLQFYTKGELV